MSPNKLWLLLLGKSASKQEGEAREGGREEREKERTEQGAIVFDRQTQVSMTKTWHMSKRGRQKAKPWTNEVQVSFQLSPEPMENRDSFMEERNFNG